VKDELKMYWYSIKCKRCGAILKPKEGEKGLRLMDIIPFVVEHLAGCYHDFFELTLKPTLERRDEIGR